MISRNLHYIPYIYSAFSGLPDTYTHYNPYICSAFSGLLNTSTHYNPYIYSAFSGLPDLNLKSIRPPKINCKRFEILQFVF